MKSSRIISGLVSAALLALPMIASAQGNPYGYGYSHTHNGRGQMTGTIAAVNGGAIQLQNGRTVFLHNGTVINPTGTRLQPGMRVSIIGSPAGDGNINASEVDINGNGNRNGYYRDRDYNRDYYNR